LWGEKWLFLKGSGVWRRFGKIIGAAELHEKNKRRLAAAAAEK
jgi:hypothetical protein